MSQFRNENLIRFLAPEGAPELCRALALRRTFERWILLRQIAEERPNDYVLAHVLHCLPQLTPAERHAVLGSPDGAVFTSSHLEDSPNAAADLAILGALHTYSPPQRKTSLSLQGHLICYRQGVGRHIIHENGTKLEAISVTFENDELLIEAHTDTGKSWHRCLGMGGVREAFLADRKPVGDGAWELVDGWSNFNNPFKDGNDSPLLDETSRIDLIKELQQAWKLTVEIAPKVAEEMRETAQYLRPIRPQATDTIPSFSSRELPGVIFVGTHRQDGRLIDFLNLADSCFHEHLHNRLYLLESAFPLTVPKTPPCMYWSPWKTTERGIDGMLHAIYVFAHLAWFWHRVAHVAEPALVENAREWANEHKVALHQAMEAIRGTEELTPAGREVVSAAQSILNQQSMKLDVLHAP